MKTQRTQPQRPTLGEWLLEQRAEPVELLDSAFDSVWAPPLTLRTADAAPRLQVSTKRSA